MHDIEHKGLGLFVKEQLKVMGELILKTFNIIYGIGAFIFAICFATKRFCDYKSSHTMFSTGPISEAKGWLTVFGIYFVIGYFIAYLPLAIFIKICEVL